MANWRKAVRKVRVTGKAWLNSHRQHALKNSIAFQASNAPRHSREYSDEIGKGTTIPRCYRRWQSSKGCKLGFCALWRIPAQ
jgi:hypothetical protein